MKAISTAETSHEKDFTSRVISIGRFFFTHWMMYRHPMTFARRPDEHKLVGVFSPVNLLAWSILILLVLSAALPLFSQINPALDLTQQWYSLRDFVKTTDEKIVIFHYSSPVIGLIIGIALVSLLFCVLNINLYRRIFSLACYSVVSLFNAIILHFFFGLLLMKLSIAIGVGEQFLLRNVHGLSIQYIEIISFLFTGYPFLFMLIAVVERYSAPGFIFMISILFVTGGCAYVLKHGPFPVSVIAGDSMEEKGNGKENEKREEKVPVIDSGLVKSNPATVPIAGSGEANSYPDKVIDADTVFTTRDRFTDEANYAYVNNYDVLIEPVTDWPGHGHIKLGKSGRNHYMHLDLQLTNTASVPTKLPKNRTVKLKLKSGKFALLEQKKGAPAEWIAAISLPEGSSLLIHPGSTRTIPVKKHINKKTYDYLLREAKKNRFGENVLKVELIMGEGNRKFLVNKSMAFVMDFVDKGLVYPDDIVE